jgi:hypothetical protein
LDLWVETMASKYPGREGALERRKTNNAPLIMAEYKLHYAAAQTTDAIVEKNRIGVRHHLGAHPHGNELGTGQVNADHGPT